MKPNKILVVGGGTAGLIAAIILKTKLNVTVDVVHSKNIGIIGVGEGSTEHWKEFISFAGIDQYDLIKNCDATYKSGIMFSNWGTKDFLHSVAGPFDNKHGQYGYVYAKQIAESNEYFHPSNFLNSTIDVRFLNARDAFPANQFHFNTHKLNNFLIDKAKSIGISVLEDDINDVLLKQDGSIDSLIGGKQEYNYDFYIDSTGFKRILMSKLGAKWKSYKKYLKMKSAIVFQTSDESNYNLWTLAKAMDHGWRFKIPVWGRHGNGYIFDSDYITADDAQKELEKELGDIEIRKQFNFDPGCLESAWIKNCCAIGVSANFVEPLEASSIGTSIQQSFLLMHKISNYTEKTIQSYNKSVNSIMENIRDFIVLHYQTKKNHNSFWRDLQKTELPESLLENLEMWKYKLPIREDFSGQSNYILFTEDNYTLVMNGLDLFDRKSIYNEYQTLNTFAQNNANLIIDEELHNERNLKTITHKNFLKLVRDYL